MHALSIALALVPLLQHAGLAPQPEPRTRTSTFGGGDGAQSFTITPAPQERSGGAATPTRRAWLGVMLENQDGGVHVSEVVAGSPAERAKLRAGDRIESIAGVAVEDFDGLLTELAKHEPGASIDVAIARRVRVRLDRGHMDGERYLLGVSIGERADGSSADGERGALITQVHANYPAARAGLQPNDRILSIGERDVTSSEDVVSALGASDLPRNVELRVARIARVELGANPAVQPFEQLSLPRFAPLPANPPATPPSQADRQALAEELRALSHELRALREQVAELRAEIDRLRER